MRVFRLSLPALPPHHHLESIISETPSLGWDLVHTKSHQPLLLAKISFHPSCQEGHTRSLSYPNIEAETGACSLDILVTKQRPCTGLFPRLSWGMLMNYNTNQRMESYTQIASKINNQWKIRVLLFFISLSWWFLFVLNCRYHTFIGSSINQLIEDRNLTSKLEKQL